MGEILGNVYMSWMCCGIVVNHTYQCMVVGDGEQLQLQGFHPTEVCLHAEMQRAYTCYTTEITNHCYTAKITLCSLVGDCLTPVSQHRA